MEISHLRFCFFVFCAINDTCCWNTIKKLERTGWVWYDHKTETIFRHTQDAPVFLSKLVWFYSIEFQSLGNGICAKEVLHKFSKYVTLNIHAHTLTLTLTLPGSCLVLLLYSGYILNRRLNKTLSLVEQMAIPLLSQSKYLLLPRPLESPSDPINQSSTWLLGVSLNSSLICPEKKYVAVLWLTIVDFAAHYLNLFTGKQYIPINKQ